MANGSLQCDGMYMICHSQFQIKHNSISIQGKFFNKTSQQTQCAPPLFHSTKSIGTLISNSNLQQILFTVHKNLLPLHSMDGWKTYRKLWLKISNQLLTRAIVVWDVRRLWAPDAIRISRTFLKAIIVA